MTLLCFVQFSICLKLFSNVYKLLVLSGVLMCDRLRGRVYNGGDTQDQ